jgi:glutamate synthase domain-containing protein 2
MTAPMDTVVDLTNFEEFLSRGITACLPRTIPYHSAYQELTEFPEDLIPSIGLSDVEEISHRYPNMLNSFKTILIDVANGHMERVDHAAWHLKQFNKNIKVMIGNIGNPETYRWYAERGNVDYIRVGIGNGGGCLTTKQSGVGYPMASLIRETAGVKNEMSIETLKPLPAIVADGGMKDYADIIKSLALGADFVMLGSLFNKTLESCAQDYHNGKEIDREKAIELFNKGREIKKYFRGMSTKGAQKAMGKQQIKTSEGVERFRKVGYTLNAWVENFEHYLRNAMSYSNARTLDEFIGNAEICQITTRAYDRFNK